VASTIGIKIANGEFYSLVDENSAVKKRLILTTVHDRQRSVQIDLYKSAARTMADALYIGSLVVENIKPRTKGEPSIEMVIASTPDGTISADAVDLDAASQGGHQSLNVSLQSLDDDSREFDIPDFELEPHEPPPAGLYERANTIKKREANSLPWLIVAVATLVVIIIILGVWFFLLRNGGALRDGPSAPVAQGTGAGNTEAAAPAEPAPEKPAAEPAVVEAPKPPPPPPETPVIEAPVTPPAAPAATRRVRPPAPVASYKVPTTIPQNGAPYTIRWGDTLWDIAGAFYRNPWLYPRIARFNNIRNPDLIISGRTIRIPPRN
jgi:hypothetical protein